MLLCCCSVILRAFRYDEYVEPGEKEEKTTSMAYKTNNNNNINVKKSGSIKYDRKIVTVDHSTDSLMSDEDLFKHSQSHYMPKGNLHHQMYNLAL